MGIGLFKGLRVLKISKGLKNVKTVGDVAKVSKLSKFGTTVKNLPVIRIIAGSAVGIAILDTWNKGTNAISEYLGVSEESSALILGCAAAAALAVVVVVIINLVRGR